VRPRCIAYIAASADGYIADAAGGLDWLAAYDARAYGYDTFLASIGTIVMGRATFDEVLRQGTWPYPGKAAFVLTSRALQEVPAGADVRAFADIGALAAAMRKAGGPDVWIEGGGRTLRALLDLGVVDRLDLYVIPILLGDGIALFPRGGVRCKLALAGTRAFPDGVVGLSYTVAAAA
jgi:dihydrofolate reductase